MLAGPAGSVYQASRKWSLSPSSFAGSAQRAGNGRCGRYPPSLPRLVTLTKPAGRSRLCPSATCWRNSAARALRRPVARLPRTRRTHHGLRRGGRAGGPSYSASARRPASVIVSHVTTISRRPARTVRRSAVASPLRTKSCSVPIPKPCASMIDSVLPFGLRASICSASRWSAGIAIAGTVAHRAVAQGSNGGRGTARQLAASAIGGSPGAVVHDGRRRVLMWWTAPAPGIEVS